MLRPPVVLVFVLGVFATASSLPAEPLVLQSDLASNQVEIPVLLDSSQQRVRLRATLDAADVTADAPTTPSISADIVSQFDDEARAVPARVRAGLRAPEDIDDVDIALLTFFSPDESHGLSTDGDVIDLLLVREDDGDGLVSLDVVVSGAIGGAGDIDFGGTGPVISVVRVPEEE
ncbi:MAG: hypothetical protein Q8O67_32560 [Deltaproteobacteria bacterium]|nr:hypothetical protein [Deltaproteobacteria bacterium]